MITKFHLTTLNAALNLLSAIFLFSGFYAIKSKNRVLHKQCMLTALICSSLFLISYVTAHLIFKGVTHYPGEGIWKIIYFLILGTHTPLAIVIVPFSLMATWHALKENFVKHVRITRWLFWVWSYVSVTGVVIYLMLYIF